MMSHFYVYYRVAHNTPTSRATVEAFLAEVAARTGIAGRLLVGCDDPATWMEVYEPVPDAAVFAHELEELVGKHAVAAVAAKGERHVERFVAASSLEPNAKR